MKVRRVGWDGASIMEEVRWGGWDGAGEAIRIGWRRIVSGIQSLPSVEDNAWTYEEFVHKCGFFFSRVTMKGGARPLSVVFF